MSNQNAKGKSKYETPTVVPLGGLAHGVGEDCAAGISADQ